MKKKSTQTLESLYKYIVGELPEKELREMQEAIAASGDLAADTAILEALHKARQRVGGKPRIQPKGGPEREAFLDLMEKHFLGTIKPQERSALYNCLAGSDDCFDQFVAALQAPDMRATAAEEQLLAQVRAVPAPVSVSSGRRAAMLRPAWYLPVQSAPARRWVLAVITVGLLSAASYVLYSKHQASAALAETRADYQEVLAFAALGPHALRPVGLVEITLAEETLDRRSQHPPLVHEPSHFAAALQAMPDNAEINHYLGTMYALAGEPSKARTHLLAAIKMNESMASPYNDLAMLEGNLGNYERALELLGQALVLAPDLVESNYNYALTLELAGQPDAARTAWHSFLALVPEQSHWLRVARSHLAELQ